MKKQTISIGISAHNEEQNITHLLCDLSLQKIPRNFSILEIIVVSDGSTDHTIKKVKALANKNIKIVPCSKRKGKAYRLNQLMRKALGDILVILDADIQIIDTHCLEKLIEPIAKKQADLTSARIEELPSFTHTESVLQVSMRIKKVLFNVFKGGHNVYTCYGPARAFSRKFFYKLSFPLNEGEDMISYFACVLQGYTFRHVRQAVVYYKLPANLPDHTRQSLRYINARKIIRQHLGDKAFNAEIKIPLRVYFLAGILSLPIIISHPIGVATYLYITLKVFYAAHISKKKIRETWRVKSTKNVRLSV